MEIKYSFVCRIKLLSRSKISSLTVRSIFSARRPTSVGMPILVLVLRLLKLPFVESTLIRSALSLPTFPFVEPSLRVSSSLPRWSALSLFAVTTSVTSRSTDGRIVICELYLVMKRDTATFLLTALLALM